MIYFIQQGQTGPIKIGHALNVARRLGNLQIGNPDTLHLLATAHGDARQENELHARFNHTRLKGEWFHPSPDLMDYINDLETIFKPRRSVKLGENDVECRLCGLRYLLGVAKDEQAHNARHDAIRDTSLPHPLVEYLKDWGGYIAVHGELGTYGGKKISAEMGKRIYAFAVWVDSQKRLENPSDFESFMADRLDEFDNPKQETRP